MATTADPDRVVRDLVDEWVREELLYREGLALRLDRNDPVIRRRIARRLDFIAESRAEPPGSIALEQWLADHPADYRIPARYAIEQKLFVRDRHGDDLETSVAAALERLRAGDAATGDPTLLPDRLGKTAVSQIARVFGEEFARALEGLPVDTWSGPVASGYGLHLVRVTDYEPARQPTLDEVRPAVMRDVVAARTAAARASFVDELRSRYTVRIEAGPALADRRGED